MTSVAAPPAPPPLLSHAHLAASAFVPSAPPTTTTPGPVIPAHSPPELRWSKLSPGEKLACIGPNECRGKYGGMTAWPAAGCLLEKWNDTIHARIMEIFSHEENQRKLRGRLPKTKKYLLSPLLFMLNLAGIREEAMPYVIFLHKKLEIARRAVKLLQEDHKIAALDFQYLPLKSSIKASAAGNARGLTLPQLTERTDVSLCGRAITVCPLPVGQESQGRLATIGGILKFGAYSYYALTSAHVFFNSSGDGDVSTDDESDEECFLDWNENSRVEPAISEESKAEICAPTDPDAHAVFLKADFTSKSFEQISSHPDADVHSARHIGNAFTSRVDGEFPLLLYNEQLDWALVEITDPRFWDKDQDKLNSLQVSGHTIQPRPGYGCDSPPETELLVLTDLPGLSFGKGIGTKSAIDLPWRADLVEAWAIECRTGLGACGAWVIERDSCVVVGIVVAHSLDTDLTWMLPADEIFKDIKHRWQFDNPLFKSWGFASLLQTSSWSFHDVSRAEDQILNAASIYSLSDSERSQTFSSQAKNAPPSTTAPSAVSSGPQTTSRNLSTHSRLRKAPRKDPELVQTGISQITTEAAERIPTTMTSSRSAQQQFVTMDRNLGPKDLFPPSRYNITSQEPSLGSTYPIQDKIAGDKGNRSIRTFQAHQRRQSIVSRPSGQSLSPSSDQDPIRSPITDDGVAKDLQNPSHKITADTTQSFIHQQSTQRMSLFPAPKPNHQTVWNSWAIDRLARRSENESQGASAESQSTRRSSFVESPQTRLEQPSRPPKLQPIAQSKAGVLTASSTSEVLAEFIRIPNGNLDECNDYINRHKDLLKIDVRGLIDMAVSARRDGDNIQVQRCVQRYVIIKGCRYYSSRDRDDYFNHLKHKSPTETDYKEYTHEFEKALKEVERRHQENANVRQDHRSIPSRPQGSALNQESIQGDGHHMYTEFHTSAYPQPAFADTAAYTPAYTQPYFSYGRQQNVLPPTQQTSRLPLTGLVAQPGSTGPRTSTRRDGIVENTQAGAPADTLSRVKSEQGEANVRSYGYQNPMGPPQRSFRPAGNDQRIQDSKLPTAGGLENVDYRGRNQWADTEMLDARYILRRDAASFFSEGRVFSLMRHEPLDRKAGNPRPPNLDPRKVSDGPKGELIYSHIRRMVVVRQRQGYCVCVPINSYPGRGVIAAKNMGEREAQAHAIVYSSTRSTPPAALRGEPSLSKMPIAIDLSEGHDLDDTSRINFGKFFTIEWNIKVMNIGKIANQSMADFHEYWRQEL